MTGLAPSHMDGRTMTVRVPLALRKRGGRRLVVAPEGTAWTPPRVRVDNTMAKALARAHRWKQFIESGQFASIADLAGAEKINQSYLCRVLRLTLLAPNLVEAILDGRQPPTLQLDKLLKPFPVDWEAQTRVLASMGGKVTPPKSTTKLP